MSTQGISKFSIELTGPANIEFWWYSNSNETSKFFFQIDHKPSFVYYGGSNTWEKKILTIAEGKHNLDWVFYKGFKDNTNAWIDDICIRQRSCDKLCPPYLGEKVNNSEQTPREQKKDVLITCASVKPANGSIYTLFSYNSKIILNYSEQLDIELQIRPPDSRIWLSQGIQTFNASDKICCLIWPNLSFSSSPEVLGTCKYRFVTGKEILGEFMGPEIDVAVRNESSYKRHDYNFDYFAEVRSTRPTVDMELLYTDDGVNWISSGLIRTYKLGNNSGSQPPWVTLTWQDQPWHKTIRIDERRI